jgi:hypothetical protein
MAPRTINDRPNPVRGGAAGAQRLLVIALATQAMVRIELDPEMQSDVEELKEIIGSLSGT